MLTITHIQTTIFRLPIHGSLQWGKHSKLAEARHVLVKVILSDGSSGYAEAPPRPTIYGETAEGICHLIQSELAPRIIGMAAEPTDKILARIQEIKYNYAAKGGIDMALHTALAQSKGISLAAHLGCTQDRLKVSYILGIGDRDTVLAEAQRVYDQGVRVLKVKVGREWEDDLARIDDLYTLFGRTGNGGMALYADANECLEPSEAAYKLDVLRERGLLYCEEPLPVELMRERASLCAGHHLSLIADDSAFTVRDLRRELELETFNILNIKTARTGFTESRQQLDMARRAGKGVMIGSQASAGWGTILAAHFAALPEIDHPSELSFFLKVQEDIIDRPLTLKDGYLDLADLRDVRVDEQALNAVMIKR